MSDNCNNGGGIVDVLLVGAIIGFALYGLFIIFPLLPGIIAGYELGEYLETNRDIQKMLALAGGGVNYLLVLWYFDTIGYREGTKEKILLYLIVVNVLIYMDYVIDNLVLHLFHFMFLETVYFFLDPMRWFTGIIVVDIALTLLYIFAGIVLFALIMSLYSTIVMKLRRRSRVPKPIVPSERSEKKIPPHIRQAAKDYYAEKRR